MFSATSLQIHSLIKAAAPLLFLDNNANRHLKDSLQMILLYLDEKKILEAVEASNEDPGGGTEETKESDPEEEEEENDEKNEEQLQAKDLIEVLTAVPTDEDAETSFSDNLKTFDSKILSWMTYLLAGDDGKSFKDVSKASDVNKIQGWLKHKREHRKYILRKKPSLQKLSDEIKAKKLPGNATKIQIIAEILKQQKKLKQMEVQKIKQWTKNKKKSRSPCSHHQAIIPLATATTSRTAC